MSLALVMTGGGARAAYQVGVLGAITRRFPDLAVPILTGVSAGAINTGLLASHAGSVHDGVRRLRDLWMDLSINEVFEARGLPLFARAARIALRLATGVPVPPQPMQGMVDTRPLRRFLHRALDTRDGSLPGIRENLEAGRLKAVALTATLYATGQTVTFYAGPGLEPWQRPQRRSVPADLTVEHMMASAALPLFFPAVRLGQHWYGDGGIRLVAPLAPALHLGASRILAVSTHHRPPPPEADRPAFEGAPSAAQILGVLYNSIFLDQLDQDALHLDRINRLIADRPPDAREGLRPVKLLVLRPRRDLSALANEFEPELPRMFRFLTRRLGTKKSRRQDLLSTLMFDRGYVKRLVEVGEEDGAAQLDEIEGFLAD